MTSAARLGALTVALALALGASGCGAAATHTSAPAAKPKTTTAAPVSAAHPQVVQPVAGAPAAVHTRGQAEDIGVNSLLRSSAAQISEAQLARFDLYRPFDPSDDPGNSEVNHVQLIPVGGPLTLAQAASTFDPDPSCK